MSIELLERLIIELISSPQFTTPDTMAGHGYGRTGKPIGPGMHRTAGAEFPYTGEREEPCDCECDTDELDLDTLTGINKRTLAHAQPVDNSRTGDNFSYFSGNVKINEDGADALPRLITLRPRSGRNAGGSQFGWSHAPPPFTDDVDDEIDFDIEDIVRSLDEKPLKHGNRRSFQRCKSVFDR